MCNSPWRQRNRVFSRHLRISIPAGYRQSEMRFYLLKLSTDSGLEGVAAVPGMKPERFGLGPLMGNYIMIVEVCLYGLPIFIDNTV